MAEQFMSITEARKQFPSLSQAVQGDGDQYVITNLGKPQAVLLGYEEYKGLMAATELLNRPRDLAHLQEGLTQTEKLSFEQLRENLRLRRAEQSRVQAPIAAEERFEPLSTDPNGNAQEGANESLGWIKQMLGTGDLGEHLQRLIANSANLRKEDYVEALKKIVAGKPRSTKSRRTAASAARKRRGATVGVAAAADPAIAAQR